MPFRSWLKNSTKVKRQRAYPGFRLAALMSVLLVNGVFASGLSPQISATSVPSSLSNRHTLAQQSPGSGRDPSWQEGKVALLTITRGGHTLPIRSVAFSPDGQYLASASADATIKIWNMRTGTRQANLILPQEVDSVAFSPDGQYLASGSYDGSLRLWDWRQGQLIRTFPKHSNIATSIAITPDNRTLVSGSLDGRIRLWEIATGRRLRDITGGQGIQAITITPDGSTIIGTGIGGKVGLWKTETGELIRLLPTDQPRFPAGIEAIAISPDGQTLAFSPNAFSPAGRLPQGNLRDRNTIGFWNIQGRALGPSLMGHRDYVTTLAFSPSGQTLVSGSLDQTIKIWDVESRRLIRDIREDTRGILAIAFRPDGRAFATGSRNGTLRIFVAQD